MTEREFRDKLIWDGTPPSPDYPTPLIDRAVAAAKEAGAKFEPEKVERITWATAGGGRMGFHAFPGGRDLTPDEASEVCRRYGDRAEVVAMVLELKSAAGTASQCGPEPTLYHRVNTWLAEEGSHQ